MTEKKPRKNGRPKKNETSIQKGTELANAIDPDDIFAGSKDDYSALTEQQRIVARLKLRGLSQVQIATYLNISQPAVSKHLSKVKDFMREKGSKVDQSIIVGETTTVYEEVEAKSWELYHTSQETGDKMKALALVLQARDKQTKLLMDLGHLERAGTNSKVEISVSPLVQSWRSGEAQQAVEAIIAAQLKPLAEPVPPELPSEIQDAEFFEIEDD